LPLPALARICFSRFTHHPERVAALLAVSLLTPFVGIAAADPDTAAAGRTVKKHVGGIDRHLLGEPSALRILPAGLQVLVTAVDPLDYPLVFIGQHAEHAAGRAGFRPAGVVSSDHFHDIVFMHVHDSLLDHLSGEADDSQKASFTQLTGNGAENARAARVLFRVDQHQCVAVETDVAPIVSPCRFPAANDDAPNHVAWLNVSAGDRFLYAGDDDIAESRITPPCTAEHLNAHAFLGAGVIGHVEVSVHL